MARNSRQQSPGATGAPQEPVSFRDRIVGFERIKASDLKKNARNWRLHPESQKGALRALLEQIGFVGAVLVRKVGDGYELLDGHLRTELADDADVPVLITDLNDEEAAKVLATYDPLSSMAVVDETALSALLVNIDIGDNAELRRMIADLHDKIADEEKAGELDAFEAPGMALQPHEHYDYLVILATTSQEWNMLCERLKLAPAIRRGHMGTSRAIRATRLLEALGKPSPQS